MFPVSRWDMRLTDRAVLKAIASIKKPENQQTLADSLGCHERTVRRSLKRLKALGYVEILGGGNRYTPYEYKVNVEVLPDDLRSELERG